MTALELHSAAAPDHGVRGGDDGVRWLLQSVKPDDWLAAIDYWSAWLVASGVRPRTIELRRYQLGHLAQAHLNRSPWALRTNDLMAWLADQDWSPETRKSYRSALRSFYGWAERAGETRHNPAAGLPAVRTSTAPPRPAPDHVLAAALERAGDRDRLILLLAAYAGLRRAEIAGLRWADAAGDSLRVTGKGGRVRLVPVHRMLRAELDAARETACGPWCLPGRWDGPITAGTVGRAAAAALGGGWTAHTLRHRFATRAYAGSHDLLAVQALLGHTNPETTKRYTELSGDALAAAVRTV